MSDLELVRLPISHSPERNVVTPGAIYHRRGRWGFGIACSARYEETALLRRKVADKLARACKRCWS